MKLPWKTLVLLMVALWLPLSLLNPAADLDRRVAQLLRPPNPSYLTLIVSAEVPLEDSEKLNLTAAKSRLATWTHSVASPLAQLLVRTATVTATCDLETRCVWFTSVVQDGVERIARKQSAPPQSNSPSIAAADSEKSERGPQLSSASQPDLSTPIEPAPSHLLMLPPKSFERSRSVVPALPAPARHYSNSRPRVGRVLRGRIRRF